MPRIPIHRIKKQKLIWLNNHKCEHGHSYIDHYNCYLREHPEENRIGYFDIESSNLDANFGICLCYCIKEAGTDKILGRHLTKEEALSTKHEPDKQLMKELVDDLSSFDILYTYYGTRFDFPFVRTRAVAGRIPFPVFGSIKHTDMYYVIRNKFKLHRSSLEVACQSILGRTLKTHFEGDKWRHAVQGNQEALGWIFDHCKRDVTDLELLSLACQDYMNPNLTRTI